MRRLESGATVVSGTVRSRNSRGESDRTSAAVSISSWAVPLLAAVRASKGSGAKQHVSRQTSAISVRVLHAT